MKTLLRQFLKKAEIDHAVFFGLLAKVWVVLAGPITAVLIATRFTSELQGYYFTFLSLFSLQVFIDQGLGVVIIQFASHEWSKLSLNKKGYIEGDPEALSRLASLTKIIMKWYSVGSLLFIFCLSVGGYIFFSQSHSSGHFWALPWVTMCIIQGVSIFLIPIWSLLEGCNQVSNLYTFRFWQGVFAKFAVWIAILYGTGLWAMVVSGIVALLYAGIFIKRKYFHFLKTILSYKQFTSMIKWREDLLPMQWRIAVSWMSGYFAFFIFTPVLFHYHGAVVAGQFGMTWNIIFNIGVISTAWLNPKIPRFGMLIAQRKYKELDSLFWRVTKISVSILILSSLSFWVGLYLLNQFEATASIAQRFISPLPAAILLLAIVLLYAIVPFTAYIRAHKREPLMPISIASGILNALSAVVLGKYFGSKGVALGILGANMILTPLCVVIWHRCRIAWHKE